MREGRRERKGRKESEREREEGRREGELVVGGKKRHCDKRQVDARRVVCTVLCVGV